MNRHLLKLYKCGNVRLSSSLIVSGGSFRGMPVINGYFPGFKKRQTPDVINQGIVPGLLFTLSDKVQIHQISCNVVKEHIIDMYPAVEVKTCCVKEMVRYNFYIDLVIPEKQSFGDEQLKNINKYLQSYPGFETNRFIDRREESTYFYPLSEYFEQSSQLIKPYIQVLSIAAIYGEKNSFRLYGIGFPTKTEHDTWKSRMTQLDLNDHKLLGQKYQLFTFHKYSPGMVYWLPKGTLLFNRLCNYLRTQLFSHGYEEVKTPQLFNIDLFNQSGHLGYYSNDMFFVNSGYDSTEESSVNGLGLKPMNCPAHCVMYGMSHHSYRDLPVRYCEFSALHRNESSGSLFGLTRLRQFHQDDGHIFVTMNQLYDEIKLCFRLINNIYSKFGLKYEVALSTCPDKFIGNPEDWLISQGILKNILNDMNIEYTINDKDGAFYGPKIDIYIQDNFMRKHQCGTIQLDFQFPKRFDLKYRDEYGNDSRPIIIHRAILGSIERFISIYLEHTEGKLPFWLSPYQLLLIPINDSHIDYCKAIKQHFSHQSFSIDIDTSEKTLAKKVKLANDLRYHLVGIIGDKERDTSSISIRRNNKSHTIGIPDFKNYIDNIMSII